ncbi:hypothetical protein ACFYTF_21110 [Nocardia thailandica]|uniref:HNH endonuclease n=1 Tax=Nocardia thailandica TaxID=257275 RepID=A0ABW6PSD3_9NOCA
MTEPDWQTFKGGTMIRAGLWLSQVVGEGNVFTKSQLRDAFPGVSQADRRVRDLRKYGWEILTYTELASLTAEEQQLQRIGVPVWDAAARRAANRQMVIPATDRQAALAQDGFMCTICGISGAEPYPDDPNQTAVLTVVRRTIHGHGEADATHHATECKRCHTGRKARSTDVGSARDLVEKLTVDERDQLRAWFNRGHRIASHVDQAWAAIRKLPPELAAELIGGKDPE